MTRLLTRWLADAACPRPQITACRKQRNGARPLQHSWMLPHDP
ncbi:hypothetical protein ACKKBG_A29645 [Auxenochlorella protothecoides x Auxenochlorella symbiontica]